MLGDDERAGGEERGRASRELVECERVLVGGFVGWIEEDEMECGSLR